jgi:hypothetical protein
VRLLAFAAAESIEQGDVSQSASWVGSMVEKSDSGDQAEGASGTRWATESVRIERRVGLRRFGFGLSQRPFGVFLGLFTRILEL